MDLENIWKQNSRQDEALNKLFDAGNFSKLQSRLPLKKLRTHLLIGIVWAILITTGYIVLFFFIHIWQVYIALGVLVFFNTVILADSWKLYRKTPPTITPSNSVKEELMVHYNSFHRWWTVQQKISLFVYPVAVAGGFILGGSVGSGKPVETFLYNSKMLSILCITVLVLVPLCYFGAKWTFNYAYGKYLKQLKATIDEMG